MDNVGENNGFHYKILLFRSTSPVSISLTLGDSDAEVIELKSHETYEDACISKVNQKIVDQKVVVNPARAKKVWSIVQIDDGDLCASTSSTSSFSIINESLSNDNDCNGSTIVNDGDDIDGNDDNDRDWVSDSNPWAYRNANENSQENDVNQPNEPTTSSASIKPALDEVRARCIDRDWVSDSNPWAYRNANENSQENDQENDVNQPNEPTTSSASIKSAFDRFRAHCIDRGWVSDSNPWAYRNANNKHLSHDFNARSKKSIIYHPGVQTENFYQPGAHADYFILLGIEFVLRIIEILKDQDKSQINPLSLSLNYLERMFSSEAFMELPFKLLDKIMNLQPNDSTIEASFAKNLVKWVERHVDRLPHLPHILRNINLESLNTEQLIELSKSSIIRQSSECRDIIDRIKNDLISMSTSLQSGSKYYIYILARGYSKTWEYSIHQVNLTTGISKKIPSKPAILLATLSDKLFIFGRGNPRSRSIDVYNLERKQWTSMTNWPFDLVILSMCTYGQCIYFIASIGKSNNFYKYDPSSDEFRMILTPSRLAIQENDKILVFDKQILFISSGAAYDPVLFKWNFYAPFPAELTSIPLTAFNDKIIFLFSSVRKFWLFDPKNGKKIIHSDLDISTEGGYVMDLTVINSKLYRLEKCSNGIDIVKFDEEADSWKHCFKVDLQNEPIKCATSSNEN